MGNDVCRVVNSQSDPFEGTTLMVSSLTEKFVICHTRILVLGITTMRGERHTPNTIRGTLR